MFWIFLFIYIRIIYLFTLILLLLLLIIIITIFQMLFLALYYYFFTELFHGSPWGSPDPSLKTPDLNQWPVWPVIYKNVRNVPLSFICVPDPAPMLCKVYSCKSSHKSRFLSLSLMRKSSQQPHSFLFLVSRDPDHFWGNHILWYHISVLCKHAWAFVVINCEHFGLVISVISANYGLNS